ncbi:protein NRT1/ PTR FAMILY 5.10-like [Vitis riparia]|uniref:protein NRT1/ PTR FAMILY 5.10-like n=1 Tax=Vitis riparia TaxID=96939 RepID=UPI00155A6247|nr:protein NRT1/ PTR FAMILY 5.10-like [Vitis riparia]
MAGTPGGPRSPLLEDTVDGSIDHKGRPAKRPTSGGWRSAYFIMGAEVAGRFAYFGIQSNLINFLTDRLGQSVPSAAESVNTWTGTGSLMPLVGAFVADSYIGRYATIIIASLLYILGLGMLTLSAVLPVPSHSDCQKSNKTIPCSPPQLQMIFFFFSLYLVAVGLGGHKPCIQAFGADQFDGRNPVECIAKSSFFNWWIFGVFSVTIVTQSVLSYIQDNLNWGLGFGIPCIGMILGLLLFLLGTRTYRYSVKGHERGPFMRIGQVFIAAGKNWLATPSSIATEDLAGGTLRQQDSQQFKFLNKALLAQDDLKGNGRQCTIDDVEEAKAVLRLFPIGATCLAYAIVYAQSSTFFTKQGFTMDRSIGSGFDIPAASLQAFIGLSIVLIVPLYDRIFVPIARTLTRRPSGITMLQRIGIGMFLSAISMVIAALVEMKRLKTAQEYGLVDVPNATLPMKVWWLLPQYILFGITDVFTVVGLQEFFYDQVPTELRSVGLALCHCIFGVGSFLSSFLISAIEKATGGDGQHSWFNDNLNRAHLDYYYWVLAGLSAVGLSLYLYFAKSYIYNRGRAL